MSNRLKQLVRDQPMLRAGLLRAGAMLKAMDKAEGGLYTLLYHRVPASTQHLFEKQIQFLKRHGTFVTADAAADRVESGWNGGDRAFLLTFDDGQADNVDVALPVLRAHCIPAIQFLVSDWLDAPPVSSERPEGFMTRADVAVWLDAGLAVGSHSATHPRFARLGPAAARAEFERSRKSLMDITGRPVVHFACPWGVAGSDYDPSRDPALARECGYRTFFTTRRGRAREGADLLSMPRHVLEPHWGLHELQALLGGWKRARA